MTEGIILKGIGGLYFVKTENAVFECSARGAFRKQNISPMVGDHVVVRVIDEEQRTGSLHEILPRKSSLIRPKVANVDQVVIVQAVAMPAINLDLLDRFLILSEKSEITPIICIHKKDLDHGNTVAAVKEIYRGAGYLLFETSTEDEDGVRRLRDALLNKVSAFAGPSGVGKSSLVNLLSPLAHQEIGGLSAKIDRGKHTTRHTELLEVSDNSFVLDTPGFTSLDFQQVTREELPYLFREFRVFTPDCRFHNCRHRKETDCAVKAQVGQGIHTARYERYLSFYEELDQ